MESSFAAVLLCLPVSYSFRDRQDWSRKRCRNLASCSPAAVGLRAGWEMAKLLLIEDEAGMRLIVRVNLEPCGHELVEAADGAAGLGLALHHTDLAEPAGVPTATSSLGPRLLCLTLRPRAEAVAGSKGEAASSLCPRS